MPDSSTRPAFAAPTSRTRFSLRQLEAFCAVARLANASQAAAEIGRTPSAVSMALRDLEQALGVSLFERRGRTLALTAEQVAEGYVLACSSKATSDLQLALG